MGKYYLQVGQRRPTRVSLFLCDFGLVNLVGTNSESHVRISRFVVTEIKSLTLNIGNGDGSIPRTGIPAATREKRP